MTAQFRDTLKYKGQQYSLATEPLSPYLEAMDIQYPGTSTANYRGYIASWEVSEDKLFLINVNIPSFTTEKAGSAKLFPDQEKTFANWFTGSIRVPHGELLEYMHQGYGSLYEKEFYLRFLNGELVGKSRKNNRPEYEKRLALRRQIEEANENKKSTKNRLWSIFTK
ncbi:MAG: hypothetical protein WEA58_10825 [Balneolaceae bacterium]